MIVYVFFFSPKRSRRDRQPEADGVLLSKKDLDGSETDKKPRQSLRDAAPLEPDSQGLTRDDDKKHSETTKQAPHPSQGLRSRPYHQVPEALFIVFPLINQVDGVTLCQLKRLKLFEYEFAFKCSDIYMLSLASCLCLSYNSMMIVVLLGEETEGQLLVTFSNITLPHHSFFFTLLTYVHICLQLCTGKRVGKVL